jgi:D-aminopeptidase
VQLVNVLIATDMEGITGIDACGDCLPSHPAAYARGRRLMTDEVLVAIEALREAGAGRISVGDWHKVGTNIERERMPTGIEVRAIADLALAESEPSMAKAHGGPLDAVVMLGHHAATKTPCAFCSHTFIWEMEVSLGGVPLSEVRTYAQALAAERVPVLVASGDRWMLDELEQGELGGARLVETKMGEGRARAQSHEIAAVHAELAEAIGAACAAPLPPPPARDYPAELRIAVEGEEIARTTVGEPAELLTAIAEVFRTSQVSREYRQLARLLPADDGSRLRAARRRAGSLLARPVMAAKERQWLDRSPPAPQPAAQSG